VAHFVAYFAARQHKPPPRVSREVMDRLRAYRWPGNVRELQNVIERAVLLAVDGEITPGMMPEPSAARADGAPASAASHFDGPAPSTSFAEAERRAILRAIEASGWRISGTGGAAERLGLKPTTLHAKMKKLGIRRPGRAPDGAAAGSS
jgi:DNA-binding NtrC family response regulator